MNEDHKQGRRKQIESRGARIIKNLDKQKRKKCLWLRLPVCITLQQKKRGGVAKVPAPMLRIKISEHLS